MKIKFLSIVMAAAVAVAFTACDTKKTEQSAQASSASEQVEEEKVLEPTGDATADAKQCVEEAIALMDKDFNSVEEMEQIGKDAEAIQKKYEDFYKAKGEDQLKLFQDEVNKLEKDPEISKKFEEAQKKFEDKALEFAKSELNKAAEKGKEELNKAAEKVTEKGKEGLNELEKKAEELTN